MNRWFNKGLLEVLSALNQVSFLTLVKRYISLHLVSVSQLLAVCVCVCQTAERLKTETPKRNRKHPAELLSFIRLSSLHLSLIIVGKLQHLI